MVSDINAWYRSLNDGGHRGLITLPGARRQVWWTGKVAIGLRFQVIRSEIAPCGAEHWIQEQLLNHPGPGSGHGARQAGVAPPNTH